MASETSGVQESKNQNSAPGVNLAPRDASSPQKSLKFWFSDGNFVLQASETQYRVHRGVLSNQSSVFEDMFAFPQPITPDAADELVEGCPVVTVLDSSKDWEILLGVLYNTDSIFWEDTRSFTMEAMFAMLRLGHKYDFARFKEEALQQLKAMFPSTFVEWEKSLVTCPNQFMLIQDRYFECTRAIEDLGIQAALPVAYFLCTHAASLKQIISGRDRPDGPVFLSEETRNKLLLGHNALMNSTLVYNLSWLREGCPSEHCAQPLQCKDTIIQFLMSSFLQCIDGFILGALEPLLDSDVEGLCDACNNEFISSYNAGRERTFSQLPFCFKLADWNLLNDF